MRSLILTSLFLLSFITIKAQTLPLMVTVEGGTFKMGNTFASDMQKMDQDFMSRDFFPVHEVTLKSFQISATEITVAQYKEFCEATFREMPAAPDWGWIDNHPIINISWEDAKTYCKWLSRETGKKIELPTEAQWEYAARGGNQHKAYNPYSGGLGQFWINSNSGGTTKEVATKEPNELGLYDMGGNANEYCRDTYKKEYYKNSSLIDPISTNGSHPVIRGGSYMDSSGFKCQVFVRSTTEGRVASKKNLGIGFRIVSEQ